MHVLHHHRAVGRLGPLHGVVQRPLGQELDVLVDGQHQVLARLRLGLAGSQYLAPRIHGRVHAARSAVQLRLVFLLQAAQPVIVRAHIAQHLRRDLVVRIKALKLLLGVDSLDRKPLDARGNLGRDPPCHPRKGMTVGQPFGNLLLGGQCIVGVGVHQRGQRVRRRLLVVDLGGHGVEGVRLHRHGQLVQVAVVEHAAAGSYLKSSLLLPLGALHELLVAHHLQPEQAAANRHRPHQKEQADQPEARPLQRRDGPRRLGAVPVGLKGCLHGELLRDLNCSASTCWMLDASFQLITSNS